MDLLFVSLLHLAIMKAIYTQLRCYGLVLSHRLSDATLVSDQQRGTHSEIDCDGFEPPYCSVELESITCSG